jgi:hypothetical protein
VTDESDKPGARRPPPKDDGPRTTDLEPRPPSARASDAGQQSDSDRTAAGPAPDARPVAFDEPAKPPDPTTRDHGAAAPPGAPPGAPLGATETSGDDAILPTSLDDNTLRDAIGAPPAGPRRTRRGNDDGDGSDRSGSRRVVLIAALALLVGLTVAGFVLLGRVNAQRFVIACTTDQVSAEQGRAFPPWGTRPLGGAEWKPVTLPPNGECNPRETDSRAQLEAWFLELLVDRASTTLTARDLLDSIQPGRTNPLEVVADQLNQALLLSRTPERRDLRKEVERLLGDVAYWRASLRLREGAAALADAARQFDSAAARRPRHVTDAAQWAAFLRGIVDNLHGGPNGVQPVVTPSGEPIGERSTAPLGTALPVEPDEASAEPAPRTDAGLPTGGVLL